MRRRRFVLALCLCAIVPAGTALAAKTASWAAPQIRELGHDPATFRPDDPVTRGELAELLAAALGQEPVPVAKPEVALRMQDLDARLVAALGLAPEAKAFAAEARRSGLAPPGRFGTEVVARLLGLRTNHPQGRDELERLPLDPAPRAEAAYSAAQVRRFRGFELDRLRAQAGAFALPALGEWQRRVLATAFRLVGHPYVWGGTSERTQALFGRSLPGGFDCSGFVWRVYRGESYPGGGTLAATLRGRTTYALSGEVPRARRIPLERLEPADLVFFGAKGPGSKPAQVDHMGIYVGNGWFVHSSRYGVALATLEGWYRDRFAWGRRPLAEAGLVPAG